jgi:hypothetical protein
MKKFLLFLFLMVIAVFVIWKYVFNKEKKSGELKPVGLTVSKHSDEFNTSMTRMMDNYYGLSEAFVNWDTLSVNNHAEQLKASIDGLKLNEMEKDTAIYPTVLTQWESIKSEMTGLKLDTGIYDKRESFNMLSQQLFDLLRIVKYDVAKVYFQECPMALNNYESSGFWLSNEAADEKRRNPYLGLYDPKYSKGMLKCGETRDSLRTN